MAYKQLKVGPELLSASGESWLGYYVFALLALAIPGGGGYWLNHSSLESTDKLIAWFGVAILTLIAISTCMICHFMGHMFDDLEELKAQRQAPAQDS